MHLMLHPEFEWKDMENENECPIKLICFDLDDTLIYAEDEPRVGDAPKKFEPFGVFDPEIGPDRVVDGPNKVQVLVEGVREVIPELAKKIPLTWVSMGPQWQMRKFMEAFRLDHYFDWEIGSYDRLDKGMKVELCIDHYNGRLLSTYAYDDPRLQNETIRQDEVLFVDDNFGYLGRVVSYMPDVKVLWAHFRSEGGMQNFYRDLLEQHGIDLKKYL